jgi:hypothetical protein
MRKPFSAPAITDESALVEGTLVSGDSGGGDPGQPE